MNTRLSAAVATRLQSAIRRSGKSSCTRWNASRPHATFGRRDEPTSVLPSPRCYRTGGAIEGAWRVAAPVAVVRSFSCGARPDRAVLPDPVLSRTAGRRPARASAVQLPAPPAGRIGRPSASGCRAAASRRQPASSMAGHATNLSRRQEYPRTWLAAFKRRWPRTRPCRRRLRGWLRRMPPPRHHPSKADRRRFSIPRPSYHLAERWAGKLTPCF